MIIYNDIEQRTPEWFKLRGGKITGSICKSIKGSKTVQQTVKYELLGSEFGEPQESFSGGAAQRGIDLEGPAIIAYETITGNKVEEVGFIEKNDYVGLSPDGIIKTGEQESDKDVAIYGKAIEIKCLGNTKHARYILSDEIPKEFIDQVIHYFYVMEDLEELDFVLHNPDMYHDHNKTKIITIKRSEILSEIQIHHEKIESFRKDWLIDIKKLLGKLTS